MSECNHVVIVSQHFPPDNSGNASRVHDTAKYLVEEGWDVTILAPPPAFPHGQFDRSWKWKETQKTGDVTAYRLWAWQPSTDDPGFLSRIAYYLVFPIHALLWLLFNNRNYDVVITSSPPIFTGLAALPLGLVGETPWIVDVRDLWIDASVGLGFISEGGLLERLSRAYQGLTLRTANRVTVTTKLLCDRLVEEYEIDEGKTVHLPNGVDTSVFKPAKGERDPVIVYTGNVGHAQDLELCVRAMQDVEHPGAVLKIVGDGDIKGELERLVGELGLNGRVVFTGLIPRDEIPEILREAMIGLAPLKENETLEYAVPTKAYEYMACCVPVIATGVGEVEDLLEESGGGLFVENDVTALADAFKALLEDAERRTQMGVRGRALMVEEYDRAVVARRLGTVLDEVISG